MADEVKVTETVHFPQADEAKAWRQQYKGLADERREQAVLAALKDYVRGVEQQESTD